MPRVNVIHNKRLKCAFCKNWYDPANSAIKPLDVKAGIWEYNPRIKAKCMVQNRDVLAEHICGKFESKM